MRRRWKTLVAALAVALVTWAPATQATAATGVETQAGTTIIAAAEMSWGVDRSCSSKNATIPCH